LIRWYTRLRSLKGLGAALCISVVVCAWADAPGVQGESSVGSSLQIPQHEMHLKVLSSDLSRDDVKRLMRQFRTELGVECSYCHTKKDPYTDETDFASEENPMKNKARLMIEMTEEINRKYLSQLGDARYAEPFSCGGCHRGHAKPVDSDN
jgi:hypothetical protein